MLQVAPTTRDRRTNDERSLRCPRDGHMKSIHNCLVYESEGCSALLPYMGRRLLGVFGIQRQGTKEPDLFQREGTG